MADLQVSLSSISSFRRCEQAYYYSYVERLKPKLGSAPIELGTVLHAYLEAYYGLLANQYEAASAHGLALERIRTEYGPYLMGLTNTAKAMGASFEIALFSEMLPRAERILQRYHRVRGADDADRYTVLAVERPLRARVDEGIISSGVADLVTRDNGTGQVLLWEHKSTSSVPSHGYRLRDLQTVLYIAKLRRLGTVATGVLWNYLKTVEPKVPERTAGGRMSTVKLATTWEVYKAALEEAGLDPAGYAGMEDKLAGAEQEVFFPRFEHFSLADERLLLEDYRATARSVRDKRKAWASGAARPVRTLSRDCDRCDFVRLCTAALTGGNVAAETASRFTTPEQRRHRE